MPISRRIAEEIAYAYCEIEAGEKLLAEINEAAAKREPLDFRDAFGRRHHGLQLGIPHGTGHRIMDMPMHLARPIIEAHISSKRALISALSEQAAIELAAPPTPMTASE